MIILAYGEGPHLGEVEQFYAMQYKIGMKPTKSLKKQAEKAEAVAHRSEDTEHAEQMHNLAEAFRAQASALKAAKKKGKAKKSLRPNPGRAG